MKSTTVNVAAVQSSILDSLEGIGSWTKLRRVVAWIILLKNKWLQSIKRKPKDTNAGMKFNVNLLNETEDSCYFWLKISKFSFLIELRHNILR